MKHATNSSLSAEGAQRWCIFTSAGDHSSIRLWLQGDTQRRWDLVVAYYGDDSGEFEEIKRLSAYAFRTKGGKCQNLQKFVTQNPKFLDRYSYVWVCDDDLRMSAKQIDEAFAIAEFFQFWIAQPAFSPRGKISHPITAYAGPQCDYRSVNYIEITAPIFRKDKLIQFLKVYDGSLTGYGIDYWYLNFFKANQLGHVHNFFAANELGRFAIIDKVQVTNPHDEEKGGREIDRLQPQAERIYDWKKTMAKYELVEFPHKVFASCKLSAHRSPGKPVTSFDVARRIASSPRRKLARLCAKLSASWRRKWKP